VQDWEFGRHGNYVFGPAGSLLEVGFYASLPTLLAVMAIREGRSFRWDDGAKKAVPV
jgi:hypothetical protein